MQRSPLKFPHISRIFSATLLLTVLRWTGNVFLWSLLGGLVYVNISMLLPSRESEELIYEKPIRDPFSQQVHTRLAATLWNYGLQSQAKNEIALAEDLADKNNTSVLGANTSPEMLLNAWQSLPEKNNKQYIYWKNVANQIPGYRDALIQAGVYAYELGKTDEARLYLQKAHALDPNSQATNELLAIIQQ